MFCGVIPAFDALLLQCAHWFWQRCKTAVHFSLLFFIFLFPCVSFYSFRSLVAWRKFAVYSQCDAALKAKGKNFRHRAPQCTVLTTTKAIIMTVHRTFMLTIVLHTMFYSIKYYFVLTIMCKLFKHSVGSDMPMILNSGWVQNRAVSSSQECSLRTTSDIHE